jgi:hypothetical protein
MSERLVFELQAIDNATAPLRAVNAQLDETNAATRRMAKQMDSTGKDARKFAMGALQQAGFQIGDFAVQVANGTNKMQAFGQQAPQMLQIFGPIGAVVGAGVAVFAAFAVAMDKSSAATGRLQEALGKLGEESAGLSDKFNMLRFGVETVEEATALQAILDLNSKIEQKTQERNAAYGRARIPLDAELGVLIKQRDAAKSALKTLQDRRDALRVALAINEQMMAVELGHAQAAGQAERERIAKGQAIYAQMIAIQTAQAGYIAEQESFNRRLAQGYILYGDLRRQAQGLATDAAAAANAAIDPEKFKLVGAYGLYASSRMAAPLTPPEPDKPQRTGGGAKTDPLKELREQLALEEQLVGKTEAEQRVIQALGADRSKYSADTIAGLVEQINKTDQLNKIQERQAEIADTIKNSMSSAFMSMVDGTKSVTGAFSDMAKSIILKLYEVMVVQQIVNSIMGVVGKAFPSLAPAPVPPHRAMGGPITGGRAYLVGERGPEIVVPSRNGQVVPNNQMGSGGVTVVQNINVSTGVQQTVRNEIKSLMPQIADSAKAAVLDARRRGGSYGNAFA